VINALRRSDEYVTFKDTEIHRMQTDYCKSMAEGDDGPLAREFEESKETREQCFRNITEKERGWQSTSSSGTRRKVLMEYPPSR
jgi:hypothetical protein